jgi:hypothetical protein
VPRKHSNFIGAEGCTGDGLGWYAIRTKKFVTAASVNSETRARNFNKILIIYSQQQLGTFTSGNGSEVLWESARSRLCHNFANIFRNIKRNCPMTTAMSPETETIIVFKFSVTLTLC